MTISRPIGADGLYEAERQVLVAWDDGASIEQIVARFGYRRAFVRSTVSNYAVSLSDERAALKALIAANARYVAAFAATGKRFS